MSETKDRHIDQALTPDEALVVMGNQLSIARWNAEHWQQSYERAANVRFDDTFPPGGYVCATCGVPVESVPCAEHTPFVASSEAVERVAAAAHIAWAGWIGWMLAKIDETHANGETFRARWARQAATAYADLSEAERESDRIEARKYIAAMRGDE